MSALGHQRTFSRFQPMSALPLKADICSAQANVLLSESDATPYEKQKHDYRCAKKR
jgi:hypothetical protein